MSGPTLTASFQGLPSQHDGETAFSFRIAFSEEIATFEEEFRDHSVEVWGGRGDPGRSRWTSGATSGKSRSSRRRTTW